MTPQQFDRAYLVCTHLARLVLAVPLAEMRHILPATTPEQMLDHPRLARVSATQRRLIDRLFALQVDLVEAGFTGVGQAELQGIAQAIHDILLPAPQNGECADLRWNGEYCSAECLRAGRCMKAGRITRHWWPSNPAPRPAPDGGD